MDYDFFVEGRFRRLKCNGRPLTTRRERQEQSLSREVERPSRRSRPRTRPGQPRPFYLVWQAGLAFQAAVNDFGRKEGVALKKYMALLYISQSDALTASQLSRRLATTPQSTNELVSALEANHLLKKSPSDSDRRILHLSITEEGRQYLEHAERAIDQAEDFLLHGLSASLLDEIWPTLTLIVERGRSIGTS